MSRYKLSSINILNKQFITAACLVLFLVFLPAIVMAETIGVGVGTGKIVLDEPVKPSLTYDLPPIAVFNNGDVESDYEMSVQFNENQPEQKPSADWVTFSPKTFRLAPGKAQQVNITLQPSYNAKPGDYFAYLEASPLKKDETGTTAIAVAAATKFSFKVVPANTFMRIYYALLAFWLTYKAIIIPVSAALLIAIFVLLAKKYLKVEVKRKKPKKILDEKKESKE